ncbi:MAG: hypothetical protein QOC70_1524 [Verrucomicrobiota bacterium]
MYPIGGDYAANEDRDPTSSKQEVIEGLTRLLLAHGAIPGLFFIVGFDKITSDKMRWKARPRRLCRAALRHRLRSK